jgi:hypothetical protein
MIESTTNSSRSTTGLAHLEKLVIHDSLVIHHPTKHMIHYPSLTSVELHGTALALPCTSFDAAFSSTAIPVNFMRPEVTPVLTSLHLAGPYVGRVENYFAAHNKFTSLKMFDMSTELMASCLHAAPLVEELMVDNISDAMVDGLILSSKLRRVTIEPPSPYGDHGQTMVLQQVAKLARGIPLLARTASDLEVSLSRISLG